MTGADKKLYQMVSLPEQFIYGWLFTINSDSDQLAAYQVECCKILFEYFHGTITNRKELMAEQAKLEVQRSKVLHELMRSPEYLQLRDIELAKKAINKQLKQQDMALFNEQLDLFGSAEP